VCVEILHLGLLAVFAFFWYGVTWGMKDIWQTGGWIQAVALSGIILFCYWLLVFAEALTLV